jgi:hypothetical protein
MFEDLIYIFTAIGVSVVFPLAARKVWMGADPPHPPAYLPMPQRLWEGLGRSFVVTAPAWVVTFVSGAIWLIPDEGSGSPTAAWVCAISFTLAVAIWAWYTCFSRPRFLVPPHMRGRPAMRERSRRSQQKRQRKER